MSSIAPDSCVAVGIYGDSSVVARGLIETLSDGSWTPEEAPSPAKAGLADVLSGVSCTDVHDCVAVGGYLGKILGDEEGESPGQGTIETLHGSTWSITKATISTNNELDSVACPAVGACVAIGTGLTTTDTGSVVIETQSPSASPVQRTAPVRAVTSRPHRARSPAVRWVPPPYVASCARIRPEVSPKP